ncbi:MAG: hypothetical protein Q8911_00320 [Bacillota bacterium]|nr:hypothetical protein [Bacillota bacterium]
MNRLSECAISAPKQMSILENEIGLLRGEVLRIGQLSDNISHILRPPSPIEPCETQQQALTVADSLRDIRTIAEIARSNFESISICLEEQLGSLKLEY